MQDGFRLIGLYNILFGLRFYHLYSALGRIARLLPMTLVVELSWELREDYGLSNQILRDVALPTLGARRVTRSVRKSSAQAATTLNISSMPAPTATAPSRTKKTPSIPTAISSKTPKELAVAEAQYGRGDRIATKSVKDKKLRSNLKKLEIRYKNATARAKDAELLRPEQSGGFIEAEGELERTWRVGQSVVKDAVDVATAQKGFGLRLGFGSYVPDYTRDGRYLLLGGRKGHIATMDWREGKLGTELQLKETVRDVKYAHAFTMEYLEMVLTDGRSY